MAEARSQFPIPWDDLSPSCQNAFSWAAGASGAEVGSAPLLAGIMQAHDGYSEPEGLMRHLGLTREELLAVLREETREGPWADGGSRAPPDEVALDAEAGHILERSLGLAAEADPFHDGKLHLPHLFGGVLLTEDCDAYRALARLVEPTVPMPELAEHYRVFLSQLALRPSLRYPAFLTARPLRRAPGPSLDLPPGPPNLVGRESELESVVEALRPGSAVVLSGGAGVGKTALAIRAAHLARDEFSGGQLFLTVGDDSFETVSGRVRTALGVTGLQDLPPSTLIVLDDVRRPEVITTWGMAPYTLLFTTRNLGHVVPVRTGRMIALTPLQEDDAIELLGRLAGTAVANDSESARELARLAGGFPRALEAIAAPLAANGAAPAELWATLVDRMAALPYAAAVSDDLTRRRDGLERTQRRVFRRLALLDGAFSAAEAAAPASMTPEDVEPVLAHLASVGLLDGDDGSYSFAEGARDLAGRSFIEEEPQDEFLAALLPAALPAAVPVAAGYVSDAVHATDELGFADDVDALARVLIAKDVHPPLSVGLFGEWGTGKSTFMELMQARIDDLSRRSRGRAESSFCPYVRQITFNAWHYADANLWASLVTHILEELAKPDGTEDSSTAEEHNALVKELETSQTLLAEATREKAAAAGETQAARDSLLTLQAERVRATERLAEIRTSDVKALAEDPELKEKFENLTSLLPGDQQATVETLDGIVAELHRTWGRTRHALRLLGWLRTSIVLVCIGAAVAGAFLLSPWLATLAAALGPLLTPLRDFGKAMRAADDALTTLQRKQVEERTRREEEAKAEIARLTAREAELERELSLARARVDRAAREIREIEEGRRFTTYVQERSSSSDYRSHLGLVALIRRDFDRMTKLLREAERAGVDLPRIDRVVLYVDDLDRCPAERVVQVLEAVHLLLALELFVVVVGVDPRWLERSLQRHYSWQLSQDGASGDDTLHWESTPQNYLEKIFQIPFAVRPMGPGGFERLVRSLLPVAEQVRERPGEPPRDSRQAGAGQPPTMLPTSDGERPAAAEERPPQPPPLDPDLRPESLRVLQAELEFVKELAPLVRTPRATKRLVNTYRLIRASLRPAALASFVLDDGKTGEYQAALILLAVLIGYPACSRRLFGELVETEASSWWSFAGDAGEGDDGDWERLRSALADVRTHCTLPDSIEPFRRWAPLVARYSFETGRLAVAAG